MILKAYDADNDVKYQVDVNCHEMAKVLKDNHDDFYFDRTVSELTRELETLSPVDVDTIIVGELHNLHYNQKINYLIK